MYFYPLGFSFFVIAFVLHFKNNREYPGGILLCLSKKSQRSSQFSYLYC